MWPQDWQDSVLASHIGLYRRHPEGFPCIDIENGSLNLESVNAAPFGLRPLFDLSRFEKVAM
jgi:hypothetical protein